MLSELSRLAEARQRTEEGWLRARMDAAQHEAELAELRAAMEGRGAPDDSQVWRGMCGSPFAPSASCQCLA